MCVLMSFTAMLTTLFMVVNTLKGSHTMVTHTSCIGIFPVVVVTDFIHRNCYISCNLTKHCVLHTGTCFPKTCSYVQLK